MVKELSLPNIRPLIAIVDGISCEKKTFASQEKFLQNVISYPIDLYLYWGAAKQAVEWRKTPLELEFA